MAGFTAPTKTPQGHDELRHRTHRLGQRHRTILLLIDGVRPVSEVLSLAHQAGAETSHFEDLVRLGLVELPAEAMAADPRETAPGAFDMLKVTSVELEVAEQAAAPPEQAAVLPETPVVSVAPREPAIAVEPVPADAPPAAQPSVTAPPPPPPIAELPPAVVAPTPRAPVPASDVPVLQQVRHHLIDTLRLDAPLFSARMFVRVRGAQSTRELIELVWEIESHLTRARHSRRELLSLQRARELLGLGNTLVDGDSFPTVPGD